MPLQGLIMKQLTSGWTKFLPVAFLLCCCLPIGRAITVPGFGGDTQGPLWDAWSDGYQFRADNVILQYSPETTVSAAAKLASGEAAFVGLDGRIADDQLVVFSADTAEVPVAGGALVVVYNLPGNPSLVLDGATLAAIWTGKVARWNDSAIASLNPNVTDLPNQDIVLSFMSLDDSITSLFKRGLKSFNSSLSAVNFSGLVPQARQYAASTIAERIAYVRDNPYSMTYVEFSSVLRGSLPFFDMINTAGELVTPSADSVHAAMDDFDYLVDQGVLNVDLFNGNGSESWPLSYAVMAGLLGNSTGYNGDCTNVQELVKLLSWTMVNDRAASALASTGFFPLTIVYFKRAVDLVGRINCGGERALSAAYLIGQGTTLQAINDWVQAYSSNSFVLKYYPTNGVTALVNLGQGDLDFALGVASGVDLPDVAGGGDSDDDKRADYDGDDDDGGLGAVNVFEGAAIACIPIYNIPELAGADKLTLNLDIIVSIYFNRITFWDDSEIVKLNDGLPLPHQPIRTIMQTSYSLLTAAFTEALSLHDSEFKSVVGDGLNVTFPIQSSNHDSLSVEMAVAQLVEFAGTVPYSFTWTLSSNSNPNVSTAQLVNPQGRVVQANSSAVLAALNDLADSTTGQYLLSDDASAWPIVTSLPFLLPKSSTVDCEKSKALVNWFYWIQTSSQATKLAARTATVPFGQVPNLRRRALTELANVECEGQHVLSVWGCVTDGLLCSDRGTCIDNKCQCNDGYKGTYCQTEDSSSDDTNIGLAAGLGAGIPVILVALCIIVGLIVAMLLVLRQNRRRREEWHVDWSEIELGEAIGMGGYGEVYRAKWRGTDVAVKLVAANTQITKDMQRNFAEEVHVMTTLRHPNVVLFMAASTKPPKMCIVMEFMALGSLHELLHNELIPDIPFKLKIKMAFQAAKGMHFLHSSGIVHRDLKSLNLLLDSKWNVKVSDFGLTKFKSDVKRGADNQGNGTVHWTAPEVLNESQDVDHVLADVYSFGIILWELLTREQPHPGMSPAAVAVAVIRNGLRPAIPQDVSEEASEFVELMKTCWHEDPTIRPTFLEIMTRLSSSIDKSRSSFTSHTSSSSASTRTEGKMGGSSVISLPTVTNSSSSDGGSGRAVAAAGAGAAFRPPEGDVVIVFTDITRAASLWEHDATAMRDATAAHNDLVRSLIARHGGYEAGTGRERNTGEGSFCVVFTRAHDALRWCADVQRALLTVDWPAPLLTHPGAAEELWDGGHDQGERVIYRGLRVRMGVHAGHPRHVRDALTRRVEYVGSTVNAAARMTALAHGGQVVVSQQARDKLRAEASSAAELELGEADEKRLKRLGKFALPDSPSGAYLYEMKVAGLEMRFFGGVSMEKSTDHGLVARAYSNSDSYGDDDDEDDELQEVVGEGMAFKEDHFLTSANLCRWIIDFKEVQLGDQVGTGSYGVVHRGMWKGVAVAVKKFIKQKLDERRMLEFRAEMAFLSELHHPNIVLFIGACMKPPNLCIVTEFVKRGSLGEIISDHTVKLSWVQKMGMLKSAALGINYLHSLSPVIVHRDLKPSNLLVDENWNVKVADFGFARIKEENVTMTRCGTPCWTAPEVIRGEKYSEKADVYSFGVVMWEVATRKQPFAGRNFMGVSLDVLEGKRPKVPADLPPAFKKLLKRCWHEAAHKRPTTEEVIEVLNSQLGSTADADTVPGTNLV